MTMKNLIDRLSLREIEVLTLIGRGDTNRKIGVILEISEQTVETHRKHIKKKLGAKHTIDLLVIAHKHNLF